MPRLPLPPVTNFKAYNRNTQQQYEALGRFVVALRIYAHLFQKDDGKAAAAINAALLR